MKTLQKTFFILFFTNVCLCVNANKCDSTFHLFGTIKTIGIDRSAEYPKELNLLDKKCMLNILDSVNKDNYYRIIHIITMYYVFIEPDVCKNTYVDKIDSTIFAKISYELSNKNSEIAEKCRRHLEITKQFSWILQRNSLSQKALQEYIVNHNGNVDREIVSYVCSIRDTTSFWIIYKNIKEERRKDASALSFLLHNGIKYFGYYDLFLENAELLVNLGREPMVTSALYETIPQNYDFNAAKKTYSKIILNEKMMHSLSSCGGCDIDISVFNNEFFDGIRMFYPELTTSKEYINGCVNSEKFCEFDKRLYDLLVKTIKEEYKDLK